MKSLTAAALLLCASTAAFAQTQAPGTASLDTAASGAAASAGRFMTEQRQGQWLVGNLWNKKVYDGAGKSIGDVKDVLVGHDGKITAFILGVGGFLGVGEKDVAVPFEAVMFKHKDNSATWTLYMNATKDSVAMAPSYKFDRNTRTWIANTPAPSTVGGPPAAPQPLPRPRAQ